MKGVCLVSAPRLYPFLWQSFLHPALPSLLPANGFGGTCRARVTRHIFSQARPHLPAWEQKSVQVGRHSAVRGSGARIRRSFLPPSRDLFAQTSHGQEYSLRILAFFASSISGTTTSSLFFFSLFFYTLGRRELRKQ